jgi:GrpB-like predicted nucleotidyltransferase (UPF0157 family)
MTKTLFGMSGASLWNAFPIILCEHQAHWRNFYQHEKELLEETLGNGLVARINHCGSTAIPGLVAKPIIDILLELNLTASRRAAIELMEGIGYICVKFDTADTVLLKGYGPGGFGPQIFHLHLRYKNDWDELLFRDYLRKHPETASEYGRLKLNAGNKFRFDRDAYSAAKTNFVCSITELGKINYTISHY